jgi:spore coat protein A, manganese oxidase
MASKGIKTPSDLDSLIYATAAVSVAGEFNPLVFDEFSFAERDGGLVLQPAHLHHAGRAAPETLTTAQVASSAPAVAALPALTANDSAQAGELGTSGIAHDEVSSSLRVDGTTGTPDAAHGFSPASGVPVALTKVDSLPTGAAWAAISQQFDLPGDPHPGLVAAAVRESETLATAGTILLDAPAATLLNAEAFFSDWAFTNDLPIAARIDAGRPGTYVLQMKESEQWLGLRDEAGDPMLTTIWGYGEPGQAATYPGPTIVAYQDLGIQFNWKNMLPTDGHLLPVDTSIMHADPVRMTLEEGYVPTVVHLHGGHTAPGSDGLPEAWFTQHNAEVGEGYVQRILDYENDQQAATLWYHDHALGITRLNVYSGMAGFYLLRDDNELALIEQAVLPGGKYEIEMAIQDRAFTDDGQLYLPAYADDPIPGTTETVTDVMPDLDDTDDPAAAFNTYPTAVPEFFGDFILVNGMGWPRLEVEAGEYRFRMLDGSDSRFYLLQLDNADVKVTLIGGDGGLLPNAITVMDGDGLQEPGEQLVIAPGDRLDLVFDFSNLVEGDKVTLLNLGPAYEPFKGLHEDGSLAGGVEPANGTPVGEIMQFVLGAGVGVDVSVEDGTPLNANYQPFATEDVDNTRMLGLFEGTDEYGRILPQLGVAEDIIDEHGNPVSFGPLGFDAPITEQPLLGDTELWQIFNFTADAHPVHLHLVQFDVVERHRIGFEDVDENGVPDDVNGDGAITIGLASDSENEPLPLDDILIGEKIELFPSDSGAQDTSWVGPGEMIALTANFDIAGEYVWHCHILSHEDHDMMRPYLVVDPATLG